MEGAPLAVCAALAAFAPEGPGFAPGVHRALRGIDPPPPAPAWRSPVCRESQPLRWAMWWGG